MPIGRFYLTWSSVNDRIGAVNKRRGCFGGKHPRSTIPKHPRRRNSKNKHVQDPLPPSTTPRSRMLLCAPPKMCSLELLAICQSGYYMTATLYLTSEHMTVGSTGWVLAIEPRVLLSRVSRGRSHSAPFHCTASPSHLSHIRQSIGVCDSIEFTLESGDFASPFSILRETSVVSAGDVEPGIPTLDQDVGVSIACSIGEIDISMYKTILSPPQCSRVKSSKKTLCRQIRTSIRRYQMKCSSSSV